MERYTCTDRLIKNGRKIVGYVLTSLEDGSQITVETDILKADIRQGNIDVNNLTLTSDNKLRLSTSVTTPLYVNTQQTKNGKQPRSIKDTLIRLPKLLLVESGLVWDTLKFIGGKLIKLIFKL